MSGVAGCMPHFVAFPITTRSHRTGVVIWLLGLAAVSCGQVGLNDPVFAFW